MAVLTVWRKGTDRGEKWQGQNTKRSILASAALITAAKLGKFLSTLQVTISPTEGVREAT